MTRKPGWRSSEFAALVAVLLIAAAVVAFVADPHLREIALASVPAAWAWYARNRTKLKALTAALPQGSPVDLDKTIDQFIEKFVAAKFPGVAALQPEANAAIEATEALARKALVVYGVKALLKKAPQLADAIKAVAPDLVPVA